MTLSRALFLLCGLAVGTLAAAVILVGTQSTAQQDQAVERHLTRDLYEFELWMRVDASARTEALASVAVDRALTEAVRQAGGRTELRTVDDAHRQSAETRLGKLNEDVLGELRADMLIALDAKGYVVGQIGGASVPSGAGLGNLPIVKAALHGYILDDVLVYGGQVYRMAARPIIDSNGFAGALLHGVRFDKAFATRIAKNIPGTELAFFRGTSLLTASAPDLFTDSAGSLPETLVQALRGGEGAPNHAIELPQLRRLARVSPLRTTVPEAFVSVVALRPVSEAASPLAILSSLHGAHIIALWPWLAGALALGLLLAGLGQLAIASERDRPLTRFSEALEAAERARSAPRLPLEQLGGPLLQAATRINRLLEGASDSGGAAGGRNPNLDALLGPAPEAQDGSLETFAFGNSGEAPLPNAERPTAKLPWVPGTSGDIPKPNIPAAPDARAQARAAEEKSEVSQSRRGPAPPLPPEATGRHKGKLPPTPATPEAGAVAARETVSDAADRELTSPMEHGAEAPATAKSTASVHSGGDAGAPPGGEALAQALAKAPSGQETTLPNSFPALKTQQAAGAAGLLRTIEHATAGDAGPGTDFANDGPTDVGLGEDERTTVQAGGAFDVPSARQHAAHSPAAASADSDRPTSVPSASQPSAARRNTGSASSEGGTSDVTELFNEYVRVKRSCGEVIEGLTLEKFARTIAKNSEDIKAKHGANEVRFSVYVKNGRAALKALPIRA